MPKIKLWPIFLAKECIYDTKLFIMHENAAANHAVPCQSQEDRSIRLCTAMVQWGGKWPTQMQRGVWIGLCVWAWVPDCVFRLT